LLLVLLAACCAVLLEVVGELQHVKDLRGHKVHVFGMEDFTRIRGEEKLL
jgi:hypothetical protein